MEAATQDQVLALRELPFALMRTLSRKSKKPLKRVKVGEHDGVPITMFTAIAHPTDAPTMPGTMSAIMYRSAITALPRPAEVRIALDRKTRGFGPPRALVGQVDGATGPESLAEQFHVRATDAAKADAILGDAALLAWLLEEPRHAHFEIADDHVLVYSTRAVGKGNRGADARVVRFAELVTAAIGV